VRLRSPAFAVHGLLLAGLVGGPAAYVATDRSVTLDVDGEVRTVSTRSNTVGELLRRERIEVDSRDLVSPAVDSPISDGLRVGVVNARAVTLVVDGQTRLVWTTAQTVDEFARQLGGRYDAAFLSASRSTRIPLDGLSMSVRLPKAVTVTADGQTRAVVTTAVTWRAALRLAGVRLAPADRVTVDLASAPREGQSVTVTRVGARLEVRTVSLPFGTQKRADSSRYVGSTMATQVGRAGQAKETWRVTVVDGKIVARRLVSRAVVAAPVDRVLLVGTKPRPRPVVIRSTSASGLNWAALARCESSGNPRAVGGGGRFFGLYQFTLSTWRSVGGSGNPIDASSSEQTYRAQLLYKSRGASPWPVCGRLLFS